MKILKKPKISIYIASSIDGYIARSDGRLDWLDKVRIEAQESGEDCGYKEFFSSIDTLIIGRNTYETVLPFGGEWPYAGKRTIILSSKLATCIPEAEIFNGNNLISFLTALVEDGIQHIYIDGVQTIKTFLQYNLVDEITITIIPILLGSGIRLFSPIDQESNYTLVASNVYANNLVQVKYAKIN